MNAWIRRTAPAIALAGVVVAAFPPASEAGEKGLVGSYRLAKRVTKDGVTITGPEVLGFMTFTKTHRAVIMKWNGSSENPASIALIAT